MIDESLYATSRSCLISFWPALQNFESMRREHNVQTTYTRKEAQRKARHANRPYHRDSSSPGRGHRGIRGVQRGDLDEPTFDEYQSPSFGVSLSKLTHKTFVSRGKCEVRYFNRKRNLFLCERYVTFYISICTYVI